ncbi:hypothetical protein BGZ96_002803 [Linnemannia gamsii]|uniref:FAD-binding domain-containing protein n=1 Tax=Linnemannia gamsii TaxID=64522 RepID=A0ABQ7K8E3_9FUNG|nr:hypothetical protein BGZ96_002803 [Linnemannia gamsii]
MSGPVEDTTPPSSEGFKGSDLPPLVTDEPPRVLIAGAGLAGLFLGILLEKAGVPYEIFERTAEIKPLGLYDQLMSFSKEGIRSTYYNDRLKVIARNDSDDGEHIGYERILFARPELYDMLFKQIPSHKIHMSKKVLSFQQNHEGVMLRFSDNTIIHGDILVGADGAHSAIRQHLYMTLDKQGLLPKADTKAMSRGYISLLGTTGPLDPVKYPGVLKEDCETSFILGDKNSPYTWTTFTVPGNKICWNVVIQLGITEIADDQFRSSEWVPEQNLEFMDSIRHFKTIYGTLGELFDVTPIDGISKVYFEDMLFETWTHGRTVLIGDGAGAVNAMQDAVLLANHIYDILPTSFENIKAALNNYKEERFDAVKDQYPQSHISAKLMYGHSLFERLLRQVIFNWMPKSIMRKQLSKDTAYRPQANFLPQAPKRGTVEIIPQWPSRRITKKGEEEEEAKMIAARALYHVHLPSDKTDKPPHVLISGAGLAGLILGILLEKAGIPYDIYERAAEIKPIGRAKSRGDVLAPNILSAFEQVGLYEELMSFSKEGIHSTYYTDKLQVIAKNDSTDGDVIGYEHILFARPELYDMLIRQIPPNKVHMSSKMVSFEQDQDGVTVTLANNTTARGDILVGADGAHSAARKHLYETLGEKGLLPKSDTEATNVGFVSLLGTTDVLDPAKYPGLLKEDCETSFIIGDKKTPYTWCTFTVPGNKICWNVVIQLGISSIADEDFRPSDWVAQDNQKMMESIRHFPTTYGTMGDLLIVSKVSFEDKLFETWNHGRVVLIGDAAHKLLPSTGAGAVNAMQDAVLIANHIYDIKPTTHENIQIALNEYREERFDTIKDQYPQSHISAQLTMFERILRQVIFNWVPQPVMRRLLSKDTAYRPQANFLPQALKRATLDIIPQWPSKRAQKEV